MQHEVIDGKYEVVRRIGSGGMGVVYEARHRTTGRRVAVKVIIGEALAKNPALVARFQREARASSAIESEHIALVLDAGTDAQTGHPYMVMELLDGEDLQQTIQRLGPLPPLLAMKIVAQACAGLHKAHEAGIVHRDVKPANVFLARRGGGEITVKVLDFGVAKVELEQMLSSENAALTRTDALLGSPLYMSPEQAKGAKNVDRRSDVWSLGMVLYEALAGTTPYAEEMTLGALIVAICSSAPRRLQDVAPWADPEVAAIVHSALTIDMEQRFSTADAMFTELFRLLPDGAALDESMFAPLPEATRSSVAMRFASTHPASPDQLAAMSTPPDSLSNTVALSTTAGFGQSQGHDASRAQRRRVAAALAALAAVLSVVAFFTLHDRATSTGAVQQPTMVVSAANPVASPTPSEVAQRALKTVQVLVRPESVTVQVDNAPANVAPGGSVPISGMPGSVHTVQLTLGARQITQSVIISEGGPVPPQVALPDLPDAGGAASPKSTASKTAASRVPATSPEPTAVVAPTAVAKPTPPGDPGHPDRTFQ